MIERLPIAFVDSVELGIDHALEGEFDVIGSYRAMAVRPCQAVHEGKFDMGGVGLLETARRVELPFPHIAGRHVGEADKDIAHDVVVRRCFAECGIETLDIGVGPHA